MCLYTSKYVFNFQQFDTISSYGDNYFNGKITVGETDWKQDSLLKIILNCSSIPRPKVKVDTKKKKDPYESINAIYEGG